MSRLHVLSAALGKRRSRLVLRTRHELYARQETRVRHDLQSVVCATLMLISVLHLSVCRLAQVTISRYRTHAGISNASVLRSLHEAMLIFAAVTSQARS